LYGKEAAVAVAAIEAGLSALEDRLANEIVSTEEDSSLELGERLNAQAKSADDLASRWLRLISSLHDQTREYAYRQELRVMAAALVEDPIVRDIARDRLPVIVMDLMAKAAPQSRNLFNPHIRRLGEDPNTRLIGHKAYVAYDGKKVAANFSTLRAGRQKASVDVAKRLMWDLEQHRDQSHSLYGTQSHEMFLFHQPRNDPTITEKQFDHVMNVVETLSEEGRNREIKVVPRDSVEQISETLLKDDGLLLR
jgi:hypothetical protein